MAHLHDEFSIASLPMVDKLSALVMVFDVNDLSSFAALKDWVKQTDIRKSITLICNMSLSVDGDSQSVERLFGALSAHMWPGMSLKSGDKIKEPTLPEQEDLSEQESEYELEYKVLSAGSAEPWDDTDVWMSADGHVSTTGTGEPSASNLDPKNFDRKIDVGSAGEEHKPSTSASQLQEELDMDKTPDAHEADRTSEPDEGFPETVNRCKTDHENGCTVWR